jgi:hypothetical protein
MSNFRRLKLMLMRASLFLGSLCFLAATPLVFAQTGFTITPSAFTPSSVIPNETATATITLAPAATSPYAGPVSFTCAVTPTTPTTTPPACLISPSSATAPAVISLTVSPPASTGSTPPGEYQFTLTATGGGITETTTIYLTVVDVPPDYTLTIFRPISPTTISAGNGATAQILVTPVAGYSGSITLSCESITPAVDGGPICSFSPQPVVVVNGAAPPSTLTISTYGLTTLPVAKDSAGRVFYAFWLTIPGLAFVGAGAGLKRPAGKKKRTLLGLLLLLALGSSLLFLPSCSSTAHIVSNSTLVTPKNTYTITLNGVDSSGISPSNTSTGAQAAITLIVN